MGKMWINPKGWHNKAKQQSCGLHKGFSSDTVSAGIWEAKYSAQYLEENNGKCWNAHFQYAIKKTRVGIHIEWAQIWKESRL